MGRGVGEAGGLSGQRGGEEGGVCGESGGGRYFLQSRQDSNRAPAHVSERRQPIIKIDVGGASCRRSRQQRDIGTVGDAGRCVRHSLVVMQPFPRVVLPQVAEDSFSHLDGIGSCLGPRSGARSQLLGGRVVSNVCGT